MIEEFKVEDFTVSSHDLAKVLGVSPQCVTQWSNEGAFPFARNAETKRGQRWYHTSCLTMLGGFIKANRAKLLYTEPIFLLEPTNKPTTPKSTKKLEKLFAEIEQVNLKLDLLCQSLDIKCH